MELEEIRQLVQLMVDNDLSELDVSDGGSKVSLKRGRMAGGEALGPVVAAALPAQQAPAAAPQAADPAAPAEKLLEIKSPMVGTFYAAPSPDSDAFVTVGSAVGDETVVCIIEAMKVMNEIRAELAGTIAEVCVRNAQPVEYGQVLFRVRPN